MEKRKPEAALEKLSEIVVTSLCALTMSLFIAFLLKGYGHIDAEGVFISRPNPALFYPAVAVILAALVFSRRLLERVRPALLFAVLSGVLLAAGGFFLIVIEQRWTPDSAHVYEAMLCLLESDYGVFEPGAYLNRYPFQLGLVALEMGVRLFAGDNLALYCAFWLVCTLASHLLLWQIVRLMSGGNRWLENLTILLGAVFLPSFLLFLFVYGDTPGMTCTLLAVYLALRVLRGEGGKRRRLADGILAAAAMGCAACVRQNYLIVGIALAIVVSLCALGQRRFACLLLACACVAGPLAAQKLVVGHYERKSGVKLEGAPHVLHVCMGLQEGPRFSGGYNGYLYATLKQAGFDNALAKELGEAELRDRLKTFAEDPRYAKEFFSRKIQATWCEGTLGSIWISYGVIGYPENIGNWYVRALFSEGRIRTIADVGCSALLTAVYALALLNLLLRYAKRWRHTRSFLELLPYIVFLGFFFFHLAWETQSRYVFPAVFILLPAAAQGAARIADMLRRDENGE